MRASVKNKIEQLRNNIFAIHDYYNFAHSITISGLLIMKPHVIETKGKKMVGFILFQISKRKYETYRCQAFSKVVMNELLEQKNICVVNCLGRFLYCGNSYLIQIEEIKISAEFPDMPLEPPYVKGE